MEALYIEVMFIKLILAEHNNFYSIFHYPLLFVFELLVRSSIPGTFLRILLSPSCHFERWIHQKRYQRLKGLTFFFFLAAKFCIYIVTWRIFKSCNGKLNTEVLKLIIYRLLSLVNPFELMRSFHGFL